MVIKISVNLNSAVGEPGDGPAGVASSPQDVDQPEEVMKYAVIKTFLLGFILFAGNVSAQSISGFVSDAETGGPLDSIIVLLDLDPPESTLTDSTGFFEFLFSLDYVVGDVNGSDSYNGLDITYGVNFFKGGPDPVFSYECTPGNTWFVSGDVNGSCSYNGLDITYGVNFFKGGASPEPCPDCPPANGIYLSANGIKKDGMYRTNINIERKTSQKTENNVSGKANIPLPPEQERIIKAITDNYNKNNFVTDDPGDTILVITYDPNNFTYNTNIKLAGLGDSLEVKVINTDTLSGGFDMNSFNILHFVGQNQPWNTRFENTNENPEAIPPFILANNTAPYNFDRERLDSLLVANNRDSLWFKIFNLGQDSSYWDPSRYTEGSLWDPGLPDSNAIYIYRDPDMPVNGLNGVVVEGPLYTVIGGTIILKSEINPGVYHEEAADVVCNGEQEAVIDAHSINDPSDVDGIITGWDRDRFTFVNFSRIGARLSYSDTLGWSMDETLSWVDNPRLNNRRMYEELTEKYPDKNIELISESKSRFLIYDKNIPENDVIMAKYLFTPKQEKYKLQSIIDMIKKYK